MDTTIDKINVLYRSCLNDKIPNLENQINEQKSIINNKNNRVVDVEYAKSKLVSLEKELIELKGFADGVFATREILLCGSKENTDV